MSGETNTENFCTGLATDNGIPVPLKSVGIDIHIFCNIAEVTSTLTYINEEDDPVEAHYTFPVDDGSCVFQFEANIEGRHIKAEIQEKEQAKETYEDALGSGRTAMLLKEDDSAGDIFSCSLGNLPPKVEAMLTMKYVIELSQEPDGKFRFTLPTVLNPRYSPDVGSCTAAKGAKYVPPCQVSYDFKMAAVVEGYYKIVSVTSEKDNLRTHFESDNKVAKITLVEEFKFDHDLEFLLQYEEPFKPQIVLEEGNPEAAGMMKEHVILMNFYPKIDEVTMATAGEYVFVIDRSGSMRGQKIRDAKEALLLFLKSLPSECYFNIVCFGSSFELLFPLGSKKYTKESLKTAIDLTNKLDADMGGTEILTPLEAVFKTNEITGNDRRIFVLTDGEVSNVDQVLSLVREESNKTSTRVYSLGIGEGVSSSLVKGIARNGRGKAEFITRDQRLQTKVVSLLKCAMQLSVTNISLSWDLPLGVTPICIPTELPSAITAGEKLTLFAILQGVDKRANYDPSTVTLKGQLDKRPIEYSMAFTLHEADEIRSSAPVHCLATKAQITLLQDQDTAQFGRGGYNSLSYLNANSRADVQSLRQKIIDLSRHGSVVSKYTAFVAIDTKGKKVEGKAVQRTCPVPSLFEEIKSGPRKFQLLMSSRSRSQMGVPAPRTYSAQRSFQMEVPAPRTISAECSFQTNSAQRSFQSAEYSSQDTEKQQGFGRVLTKMFNFSKPIVRAPNHHHSRQPAVRHDPVRVLGYRCFEDKTGLSTEAHHHHSQLSAVRHDPVGVSEFSTLEEDMAGLSTAGNDYAFLCYENSSRPNLRSSDLHSDRAGSSTEDNRMMSVVLQQQIRGNWEYSVELLQLLNVSQDEFDKLDMSGDKDVNITLVALCWLQKQFSHRQEEWQMIEVKAKAWLSTRHLPSDVEDLIKKTADKLWP